MGPSGGGKTSIVKLVQRFYVPDAGAVLLDGLDVGAYDPRWLKRRVALVAQVGEGACSGFLHIYALATDGGTCSLAACAWPWGIGAVRGNDMPDLISGLALIGHV